MQIDIKDNDIKQGVLGLVMALVEIIRDALEIQAVRRLEGGSLTDEECERLGQALMDLDATIEQIKQEQGIRESVRAFRDSLDDLVNDAFGRIVNPGTRDERVLEKAAPR